MKLFNHIVSMSMRHLFRQLPAIGTLSFFIFSSFILHSSISAQTVGSWQIYPAYTVSTRNIPAGNRIYALMESKLMAYDTEDETTTTFDWQQQLNGISISFMHYSPDAHRLILIYDNGNIDLLSTEDDHDVINLAQLKNSTLQSKQVQNVQVQGKMAYICTGFGLLCIDMTAGTINNTYNLELSVTSCAVTDDHIYLGTNKGIWRGDRSQNLQDKTAWVCIDDKLKPTRLEFFAGRLWAQKDNTLSLSDASLTTFTSTLELIPTFMNVSDDCLIIGDATNTYIYTSPTERKEYTGTFTWNDLHKQGDTYWASDGIDGLQAYQLADDGTFQLTTSQIHPNSPFHDYSLYLFPLTDGLYVAGGNRNYSTTSREGTVMRLDEQGNWSHFLTSSVAETCPDERFLDVTGIAPDPEDPTHHYIGTARSGVFEFREGKCIAHIGIENSPLKSILPNSRHAQYYVVADGLCFDNDGNLWMLNPTEGREDTTIRVRLKDNTWTGIPCPEIQEASTTDKIFFDSRGWAWINSRRMSQRGILLIDYNGTVTRSADDKRMLRTTITNQDGTTYTPNEFYCITENLEGQLWIGTNEGPFLITEPENFRQTGFTFEQVKVSRNDGSGLADYLLSGVPILAIAIDGAQRIWFATQNNGVYLMSADCQEEIHHFKTDNSPLISDDVYDIAIDGESGRVFFATDKGICSYLSDATTPTDELSKDSVIAYPNPVSPDYSGPIVIKGLVSDSEVKILSSSGRLIWSGHSNGGMCTWNGCNKQGRRVASGIYHVVVNTSDGESAIVTRIAFIH